MSIAAVSRPTPTTNTPPGSKAKPASSQVPTKATKTSTAASHAASGAANLKASVSRAGAGSSTPAKARPSTPAKARPSTPAKARPAKPAKARPTAPSEQQDAATKTGGKVAKPGAPTTPTPTKSGPASPSPGTPEAGKKGGVSVTSKGSGDARSETARTTLDRVETYFRDRLGRDGFDDAGSGVELEIDDSVYGAQASSSRRPDSPGRIAVGRLPVGDSGMRRSVAGDVDIMAHEFTHLVISSEIAGRPTYDTVAGKNEHHAIQEGIADVFGASIEQSWDLAGVRDHASDDEHDEGEIRHARDVSADDVDPHEWGTLLVDGAVTLQEQAGWDALEQTFYDVLRDDRLSERTSMRQVAAWVVSAAQEHGGPEAARAVRAAYAANGVLPVTPPRNVF